MKNEEKTLLVVIGGSGMKSRYNYYRWQIKEKFRCRQVKPYCLEFPYKLSKKELDEVTNVLRKGVKYEIFTISEVVKQKLKE